MELVPTLAALVLVLSALLHQTASDRANSLEADSLTAALENFKRAPRVKRLIGGMAIDQDGEWPWLVHLHAKVATKFVWGIPYRWTNLYCGGTVISSRWILTAAHCFRLENNPRRSEVPKYWHVRAGETDNSPSIIDRVKSLFGVHTIYNIHAKQIIVHPMYNERNSWKHDIALIRLRSPLPLTGNDPLIRAATLPPPGRSEWPKDGEDCVMKGWGCTKNGRGITEHAQVAHMPKMADEVCQMRFGRIDLTTRICAGYNHRGIGICAGDSGGPLVCRRDGSWFLAGIASFTAARDPGDYPGVFSQVTEYVGWIQHTMRT